MSSRFIWNGIAKDVRHWTRTCVKCQASKVTRHTTSPPGTFHPVSTRLEHVHIDIVGPLPLSDGFSYILTCLDRFTLWPEATVLTDISTDTVANCHPQSNGLVERFHRQLKALIAATARNRTDWSTTLPMVLLGIRTSLKEDIGHSFAELLYGTPLSLPGEFLASVPITQPCSVQDYATNLTDTMQKLQPVPPRTSPTRTFVSHDLDDCSRFRSRGQSDEASLATIRWTIQSRQENKKELDYRSP
ncbi:uncharacterized protein LOC143018717 [Oratosquilla oratoria]|uniref:uncharacterized protein LOC143018717 n=1 Tax=Oratosquilla oratoria TaxID=337810 RepID=UPI003F76EA73